MKRGSKRLFGSILSGAAVAVALVGGCDAENALVGGECAPGLVLCDGRCLASCGDGAVAGDGGDGSDGAALDGAGGDALADGATGDGSTPDGANGDGASPDGCPPPPHVTAAACGACGIVCAAPNSACLRDGTGAFVCAPPCTPPLVPCNGRCVNLDDDPTNCGACGKLCPSNICVARVCQGSTPGDVVVVGHDYQSALAGTSQAKILTNAVFIPTPNPLRVLSYEQFSEPATVANVKAIIASGANGRGVSYTVATTPLPLEATTLAQNYDVVLIYDQGAAAPAALQVIGATWAGPLDDFAKKGGVIVALDGNAGQGGMPALIQSAGLLDLAGHTTIAAQTQVTVVAPGDSVGTLVVSPYAVFDRSVTLQSNQPNGGNVVFVTRQGTGAALGDPVVVHRVVP